MFNTTTAQSAATAFASINGYDIITYVTAYKKCLVFEASTQALQGAIYGYPIYIIVDKNLLCRYASIDECHQIMRAEREQQEKVNRKQTIANNKHTTNT